MKDRLVIMLEEGFSGRPYQCPAGFTTIGYGRNLEAKPLTRDEAQHLLENDLRECRDDLIAIFGDQWVFLGEFRQAALVSMRFQMGHAGFQGFRKMIDALKRGEYQSASEHALDSKWALQTPARAERHARALAKDIDAWKDLR